MPSEFSSEVQKQLLNKQYGLAGRHSAVQICSWTRKSLRGKGSCYKQKFYGVETYKCCQMSPSAAWCQQSCIFCWRPMEWMQKSFSSGEDADSPENIIDACNEPSNSEREEDEELVNVIEHLERLDISFDA